ncbi:hypothetical protein [Massilia niastensis]|uniref:hypothetical protein n=1 Tax=Massilia niastensis TaxID=544911 RepID=UPI0003778672|nr:hypothetical protein [Massilia niastensis]
MGAQRLDVVPTRGVNKLSGNERIGADVARERNREMFADGVQPLTDMNAQQLESATRRRRLDTRSKQECRELEGAIIESERAERRGGTALIESLQHDLLIMRKRYHQLGC